MSRVIDRPIETIRGALDPEGENAPLGDVLDGLEGTRGAKRIRVICDAGDTRAPHCLRSHDGPVTPTGWVRAPDPWGRRSRFSGTTLVLHLCAACAGVEGRRGVPPGQQNMARSLDDLSMRAALSYPEEGIG